MGRVSRKFTMAAVVAALSSASAGRAEGQFVVEIDVSGWEDRTSVILDLGGGSPVVVTGAQWDVTLTATAGWLSDGWFGLGEPGQPPQLFVIPGIDDSFPGTATYSGFVKFVEVGMPNVQLPEGLFELTFLTSGWSVVVNRPSTMWIQYEIVPSSGGLLTLALLAVGVRRRRL